MTGRRHRWQAQWSRLPNGDLQHASGLIVNVTLGDGYTDLDVQESSLVIYQASEGARGVPMHDQLARLKRLLQEATEWHRDHPKLP